MSYAIPELYEGVGGVSFPLREAGYSDSFAPLDGARDRLLGLFTSAINAELGPVWRNVTDNGLAPGHRLIGTQPVEDSIPMAPTLALMQARKSKFPLLALHREGDAEFEEHTMDSFRVKQQWSLHYILGPGDVEFERKFLDFPMAIRSLLALVIRQRGHASYDGGALQFFPGTGSLSSVRLVKHSTTGRAVFSEDPSATYWAMLFTLETTEIMTQDEAAYPELSGFDATLNLADGQEVLPEFASGSVDI